MMFGSRKSRFRRGPASRLPRRRPRNRGSCPWTARRACAGPTPRASELVPQLPGARGSTAAPARDRRRPAAAASARPAWRAPRLAGRLEDRRQRRRPARRAWSVRPRDPPGPAVQPTRAGGRRLVEPRRERRRRRRSESTSNRAAAFLRLVRLQVADEVPAKRQVGRLRPSSRAPPGPCFRRSRPGRSRRRRGCGRRGRSWRRRRGGRRTGRARPGRPRARCDRGRRPAGRGARRDRALRLLLQRHAHERASPAARSARRRELQVRLELGDGASPGCLRSTSAMPSW